MFRRVITETLRTQSQHGCLGPNLVPYCSISSLLLLPRPGPQSLRPGQCVMPGKGRVMFSVQQSLPRFPVAPLQETLNTFMKTIKPLYSKEELKHAETIVKCFAEKDGPKLQSLLENKAKTSVNWLSEWWQSVAYLDYRLPVAIHSSPGIVTPLREFKTVEDQLSFAARWIAGVLHYKVMVDNQTLPVEMLGGLPLCMAQFYQILSACRIPGKKKDSFVVFPPDQPDAPQHIVVIHNNQFFELRVYDDMNRPLTVEQLESQLHQVAEMSPDPGPGLGILTSENRNVWGTIYERLSKDKQNQDSFNSIHKSIFVVCLDKEIRVEGLDRPTVLANQMNHGCGSAYNSCNRWFDKTVSFVIGRDGAVGCNYEHSSAEGPPIISIIDHALEYVDSPLSRQPAAGHTPAPRPLTFNLDRQIPDEIERAKASFDSLIADLDMVAFAYKGFGKEFSKSQKMSPDALIQVCMQLAYRQLHEKNPPTYESGSLRRFQLGRTETIRTCSEATDAFCSAALDFKVTPSEKVAALRNAVSKHKEYTALAMQGKGCDRHLLGLKLVAIENGLNVPEFLMDPIYTESTHWRMSTSQVPSKNSAVLCFGPVVPDGYGLCYNPMPHQINFAASAWKSCKETDAGRMVLSLQQALDNVKEWLEQSPLSKL